MKYALSMGEFCFECSSMIGFLLGNIKSSAGRVPGYSCGLGRFSWSAKFLMDSAAGSLEKGSKARQAVDITRTLEKARTRLGYGLRR